MLEMRYPLGSVPARGFRCPVCGSEELLLGESKRVHELARKLGMFGLEQASVRKLQRTGTSTCVTLDPALLRAALPNAKPGTAVRVGRQGSRIIIEAA